MKAIQIRCYFACALAMLLAVTVMTPALAERQAAPGFSAMLERVENKGEPQSMENKAGPTAATFNFSTNMQLSPDAFAASDVQVEWHYGLVQTALSEEETVTQLATLLMIENTWVVLGTDAAMYTQIRRILDGMSDEEALSVIANASSVLLPDGQDGYFELSPNMLYCSGELPLMYILIQVNQDLGVQYAQDPSGSVQDCAGWYHNQQTDETSVAGDQLSPIDNMRGTLLSGEPFMDGSPIFSADSQSKSYFTPAIGIQASDGYVYSAFQALETLMRELSDEAGSTAEPTQAPTPEPTQAPTPEPTQAPTPEPTQAPEPEPTQAPEPEPTQAPEPEPTQAPEPEPTQAPEPEPTQAPEPEPTQASDAAPVAPEDTPEPTSEPEPSKGDPGAPGEWLRRKEYLCAAIAAIVILAGWMLRGRRKRAQSQGKSGAPQNAAAPEPVRPVEAAKTEVAGPTRVIHGEHADGKTAIQTPSVTLRCTSGTLAGARFPLTEHTSIGRDRHRCGIIYPANEPGISAVHCSVRPGQHGELVLTDEYSSNGTFVNGSQLTAGKPVQLRQGAAFSLGGPQKNTFVVE